ncbi:unnamed protein product [Echinostoma caproni]|uniref:PUB domain-containing protein n=1 Tax=Echinostoma caproni TaxID=27848 RepID=A0A183B1D3_9TREM|nr:unnamed protein product [Echinostoma caproni]
MSESIVRKKAIQLIQSLHRNDFKASKDEQRIMKAEADILVAIHLIKKAWVSVHPHVLINAFMKAGFKSTLIQPVVQPPEDKWDLVENSLCLLMTVFLKKKSPVWNLMIKIQAKHRKEEDEWEAVNAPEFISIGEAQQLSDQLKLFALANDQSSDTVLAWKRRNKLGQFREVDPEEAKKIEEERQKREKEEREKMESLTIGSRCEVRVPNQPTKRGVVEFVGKCSLCGTHCS